MELGQTEGQPWRQYVAAVTASFLVTCAGYGVGWMAPVAVLLRSPDTSPLATIPTVDEIAWIGSILLIGAIFGPFLGGTMASKLGRKWALICSATIMFSGWCLVIAADDVSYLLAARLLWGIYAGSIFAISPMYWAEIATDNVRGALCSMLPVFITSGYLLACCVAPFLTYYGIAYVGIGCVVVFTIIFSFMPETPTYYLLKNNREAAARSLCKLRGLPRAGVDDELNKIEMNIKASLKNSAKLKDVFRGTNLKALLISCALMFFQEFSGITGVLFYMTDVFIDSGVNLDPALATIIISIVQLISSIATLFIVDRLGRRLLLLISSLGSAIGLVLLGVSFLLAATGDISKIGVLPVVFMVLFIVSYSVGLGPLPWTLLGELISVEVKAYSTPITTIFCSTCSFIVTRFFLPVSIAVGRYTVFWAFAAFCVVSFFFTMFVVPETKGKSFQEIQDMLAGRNKTNSTATEKF